VAGVPGEWGPQLFFDDGAPAGNGGWKGRPEQGSGRTAAGPPGQARLPGRTGQDRSVPAGWVFAALPGDLGAGPAGTLRPLIPGYLQLPRLW